MQTVDTQVDGCTFTGFDNFFFHLFANFSLNDLEQLAMAYPGVTKTYAIQAGRELRVIVGADKQAAFH